MLEHDGRLRRRLPVGPGDSKALDLHGEPTTLPPQRARAIALLLIALLLIGELHRLALQGGHVDWAVAGDEVKVAEASEL
jgi:hypothetical protein